MVSSPLPGRRLPDMLRLSATATCSLGDGWEGGRDAAPPGLNHLLQLQLRERLVGLLVKDTWTRRALVSSASRASGRDDLHLLAEPRGGEARS